VNGASRSTLGSVAGWKVRAGLTCSVRVPQAWLTAFNTGDEAQGKAFDARYQPRRPMAQMAGFREQTGGFTLVRVEQADATSVTALLKENRGDHYATLTLTVSGDEPPRMLGLQIRPTPPPADLARPRLTEAEALAALTRHGEEAARAERDLGQTTALAKMLAERLLGKGYDLRIYDPNVSLAQLTGLPIVPVTFNLNWKISVKSWDRFQIPLPFALCEVCVGQIVRVPENATDAEREVLRAQLQTDLLAITRD